MIQRVERHLKPYQFMKYLNFWNDANNVSNLFFESALIFPVWGDFFNFASIEAKTSEWVNVMWGRTEGLVTQHWWDGCMGNGEKYWSENVGYYVRKKRREKADFILIWLQLDNRH